MFHFHISSFQGDEDEVESENVLSDLVNYIQPVHFKSFEHSESENINLNTAQKESSPLHTSEYILNKWIAVNQT